MRAFVAICSLPLLSLAACGGAGPETVGTNPPAGSGSSGSGTVSGGSGGGVTGGTSTTTPAAANFLAVSSSTDFSGIGGFHSLDVSTTGGTLYQGDANTVKAPGATVTYNPRDGIFSLKIEDSKAGVTHDYRFQDPAHRDTPATAANEIPNYADFNYLQLLDDATTTPATLATFFYQRPGSQTNYVSLAGFVRTATTSTNTNLQRGAFVFGQLTPTTQVPLSGTATYTGGMLATMIYNKSNTQWIAGTSTAQVDFGRGTVGLSLAGTLSGAYVYAGSQVSSYPADTRFYASGSANFSLATTGGFTGQFSSACFVAACGSAGAQAVDFTSVSAGSSTAGASSIDGAFYGPNGVNLGGSFRIVGGVPNNRVDILGAFTGARQ